MPRDWRWESDFSLGKPAAEAWLSPAASGTPHWSPRRERPLEFTLCTGQAKGPVPAQCLRLQKKGQMFELLLVYK
jgi:hypothetical protein